jgi:hypothetical protein
LACVEQNVNEGEGGVSPPLLVVSSTTTACFLLRPTKFLK